MKKYIVINGMLVNNGKQKFQGVENYVFSTLENAQTFFQQTINEVRQKDFIAEKLDKDNNYYSITFTDRVPKSADSKKREKRLLHFYTFIKEIEIETA